MQHVGWIDLLSVSAHVLVITEKMTLHHLHYIRISQYYHSSSLIYGVRSLFRYYIAWSSEVNFTVLYSYLKLILHCFATGF